MCVLSVSAYVYMCVCDWRAGRADPCSHGATSLRVRHVSEGYMHVSIFGADVPVGLSKGIRLAAIVYLSRVRPPTPTHCCYVPDDNDGLPAPLGTD